MSRVKSTRHNLFENHQKPFSSLPAYQYDDLIMALFVTVVLISNIASSAKIVDWGVAICGLRLAFDAGTILFPVSYIFGDVLTEVYGYGRARRVIWTGFGCLAISALILWLVGILPGEASWERYAGQTAYDRVLGGMSTGGIVLASLVAYFAGEFSNSFVLAKMKIRTRGKWLWTRTIGSTLVGEGVDTLIFILVANLTGVFPWNLFGSLVVTNYLFKVGVEVVMTPATYWVVGVLKHAENEDYFDHKTHFSPFHVH
ncbi:MAG: queuosine precursor transporter [Desulfobacterales bacterium]|nr:queuosine precursor transporter [Desulfobacterales bacterium]